MLFVVEFEMESVGVKASRSTSGRVTNGQKRRLLHLMQQHRSVGKGQFNKPNARKEHGEVWAAVAGELNALRGSHKSPNQWKKCWIDWKAAVKKLHNAHRAFDRQTGNLSWQDGPKPLDTMDSEILEFFSSDMVEIGLSTAAEMVDVIIEDDDDATANIGLDAIASTIIETHHAQLTATLERQHQEHMDVLNGIHGTLKALLETMAGATVADACMHNNQGP